MRLRSLALKQSPISDAIAGDPIAITMPSARRAANSVSYEVAAPHQAIASDHSAMPITSRLRRLKRSTRMPNGSVNNALDATVTATSSPISRLLMCNAGFNCAAIAPSVALSAESSARMHASMNMIRSLALPPARSSSGPSTLRDSHACNDVRHIAPFRSDSLHPAGAARSSGWLRAAPRSTGHDTLPGPANPCSAGAIDREPGEARADVPTLAGAGQCQRHVALGHRRGVRGTHRACVRVGRGVTAQHVVDAVDAAEVPASIIDLVFADRQAAALGRDVDIHGLAIRTRHLAVPVRGGINRRPAGQGECHR